MQADLRQQCFTSAFSKLAAQLNFGWHFFVPDNIAKSFLLALLQQFAI
jgi:hypothetical protein